MSHMGNPNAIHPKSNEISGNTGSSTNSSGTKRSTPLSLDEGWNLMQSGINKLKNLLEGLPENQFTYGEFMSLYTVIYNMCTQKPPDDHSQQLYDRYSLAFEAYIRQTVLPSLQEKRGAAMLKELVRRWENHKVMVRWLKKFFNYLDRYYVARKQLPGLNDVGLLSFRELVYDEVKRSAKDVVLHMINQEREGEQIERLLLKNVLSIFIEVGMGSIEYYEADFEVFLLRDTSEFYQRKAAEWIETDSCPDYLIKAEECLRKEKERVATYLSSLTDARLQEKVQNELLTKYEMQLLEKENSGCRSLLHDDKVDDLSRIFRLFRRVPKGLEPVAKIFREHVAEEGLSLVKQADDASGKKATPESKKDKDAGSAQPGAQEHAFVRSLIDLHDKYINYVAGCFQEHSFFHKALKEAFETFCNKSVNGCPSAELLSSFCDNLLKKGGMGSEKMADDAIEEMLDKVVRLLSYISEKDLFAEFYRKKLARRLLFDKSANDDHEQSILTKLKQQCGGQFTSKMEGMVKDLMLARESQSHFSDFIHSGRNGVKLEIDLTVTVLTTGFWPTYKTADLALPAEMLKCSELFREFYQTKTNNRKLTFMYSLGSCHVMGKFKPKPIELVVTTYQAALLLAFNSAPSLSYSEIKSQLNLTDEDVTRLLHSLSCAKYKILLKTPNNRGIDQADVFEFNQGFTDRMRRIKIPLPLVDEKKKVLEDVDKDRRYAIDASLVRIMKARKVLSHQQLMTECVDQLKKMFQPDIKVIKKRIEDLITREYLERDKDNINMYKYLA